MNKKYNRKNPYWIDPLFFWGFVVMCFLCGFVVMCFLFGFVVLLLFIWFCG